MNNITLTMEYSWGHTDFDAAKEDASNIRRALITLLDVEIGIRMGMGDRHNGYIHISIPFDLRTQIIANPLIKAYNVGVTVGYVLKTYNKALTQASDFKF